VIPLNRYGTTEEIANAVGYLCSAASYINGQVLAVDRWVRRNRRRTSRFAAPRIAKASDGCYRHALGRTAVEAGTRQKRMSMSFSRSS
jgi:hypothetical protein